MRAEVRAIYRRYFGAIPRGWKVHVVDGDKRNLEPSNLIAVPEAVYMNLAQLPYRATRSEIARWLSRYPGERLDRRALKKARLRAEKKRVRTLLPSAENIKTRSQVTRRYSSKSCSDF